MVGTGAGEHDGTVAMLRGGDRALDQLERHRPVEPHAALRRIHRLGDAEPEVPEVLAEGDGALPIWRHLEPGIDLGERVDDHVGGGKRDAVKRPAHALGEVLGDRHIEALEPARRGRQAQRKGRDGALDVHGPSPRLSFRRPGGPSPEPINAPLCKRSGTVRVLLRRTVFMGSGLSLREPRNDGSYSAAIAGAVSAPYCSGGTSIQRRSFQLCSAASTSCTPFAPSRSVWRYGASSA